MFHILHLLIWLRALSYFFREKSSADLGKIKVEMNLLNDSELCILTAAQTRKLNSSRRRQCRTSRRSRSKARQRVDGKVCWRFSVVVVGVASVVIDGTVASKLHRPGVVRHPVKANVVVVGDVEVCVGTAGTKIAKLFCHFTGLFELLTNRVCIYLFAPIG